MNPKEHYSTYLADDNLSDLSMELADLITNERPVHVLEFGCGTGKNLRALPGNIAKAGLDISWLNCNYAHVRNEVGMVIRADETYLRNLVNFDVVFTCSVLDHIQDIEGIIGEFKRIANKAIFLGETNDVPGKYYYPHNYESYGFKETGFEWRSYDDMAMYKIWKWVK